MLPVGIPIFKKGREVANRNPYIFIKSSLYLPAKNRIFFKYFVRSSLFFAAAFNINFEFFAPICKKTEDFQTPLLKVFLQISINSIASAFCSNKKF
jgi:hypothetical protein